MRHILVFTLAGFNHSMCLAACWIANLTRETKLPMPNFSIIRDHRSVTSAESHAQLTTSNPEAAAKSRGMTWR